MVLEIKIFSIAITSVVLLLSSSKWFWLLRWNTPILTIMTSTMSQSNIWSSPRWIKDFCLMSWSGPVLNGIKHHWSASSNCHKYEYSYYVLTFLKILQRAAACGLTIVFESPQGWMKSSSKLGHLSLSSRETVLSIFWKLGNWICKPLSIISSKSALQSQNFKRARTSGFSFSDYLVT